MKDIKIVPYMSHTAAVKAMIRLMIAPPLLSGVAPSLLDDVVGAAVVEVSAASAMSAEGVMVALELPDV